MPPPLFPFVGGALRIFAPMSFLVAYGTVAPGFGLLQSFILRLSVSTFFQGCPVLALSVSESDKGLMGVLIVDELLLLDVGEGRLLIVLVVVIQRGHQSLVSFPLLLSPLVSIRSSLPQSSVHPVLNDRRILELLKVV